MQMCFVLLRRAVNESCHSQLVLWEVLQYDDAAYFSSAVVLEVVQLAAELL